MTSFLIRRLLTAIPVLFGLLLATFLLIRVVPSDPAMLIAGEAASPEQIQAIRETYGFDRPLPVQFLSYLNQVLRFDFGVSHFSGLPVGAELARRLPATLELIFSALVVGTVVGIPLGTIAAVYHNRLPDVFLRIVSVIGVAVASFWLAIMLQLYFALELSWLPLRGRFGGDEMPPGVTGFLLVDSIIDGNPAAFLDTLQHLLLPTLTLSLAVLATIIRFTRAGVLDTLQKEFVLFERAVGFPRRRLIWVYILRNSVIAAITQIGLLFGGLIAGAVVVEAIFDWPGIGSYTVNAILAADSNVMMAVTLVIGIAYTSVNVLVDVIHGLVDPQLREGRR